MEESVDMSDGWIIECNEGTDAEPRWCSMWETFFIDEDAEADRLEKLYSKRRESFDMTPRPFTVALEQLKKLRALKLWGDYRFRNLQSGMIIHACILR